METIFLSLQTSWLHELIRDEIWLEGERRGCFVRHDDPVVLDRVCEIVLRDGALVRELLGGVLNGMDAG